MNDASWRRGERIAPPSNFHPTAVRLTQRHSLYVDATHGYVKQVASRPGDPSPTVYFRLLSEPITTPRRHRGLKAVLATVMVAGLALLVYPLLPGWQYQVARQVQTTVNHTQALASPPPQVSPSNEVIIPKIGVHTAILEGSSLGVLDKADGVWHQTGTLQTGNFVLAGHRFKYLPPNTSTLYNLGQLAPGDVIIVDWYKTRYIYVVDRLETVPATRTSILDQTGGPRLTIYTCTNSAQTLRTVVLAHRQD